MTPRERYESVLSRVGKACQSVGKNPEDVCLIAVSKTQPIEAILALYELGHRDFGESRWQELQAKKSVLPADIIWHFIGPLQTNKAKRIAQECAVVHSLYRPQEAKEIAKVAAAPLCFLEVNADDEPQKAGVSISVVDESLASLREIVPNAIRGLMTVGRLDASEIETRKTFSTIRALSDKLQLSYLSMGMSRDYEWAIQEGATHIRVGTVLFGDRT